MRFIKDHRLFLFVGIIALAIAFWYVHPVTDALKSIFNLLEHYALGYERSGIAIFVLLAALSAMLSLFSSIALIPPATAIWGTSDTTAMLLLGWLIGDTLAYMIGRGGVYPLVKGTRFMEHFQEHQQNMSQGQLFGIALLLRLALPAEIGYIFGVVRYDFIRYMMVTILAETPFAILSVITGGSFIERDPLMFLTGILSIIVLVSGTGALYRYYRKQ